jgi:hypothetical protein
MQCFTHPNEASIGVCKSCGKGVCRSCALPVDRGLACSEPCKPYAAALSRLQAAAIRNIGLASAQKLIHPLGSIIFLGAATYFALRYGTDAFVWVLYATGGLFGLISIVSWFKQHGNASGSNDS